MENTAIKKAHHDKELLSKEYCVPVSSIVWIGDNHYIIVKNGGEIRL